MPNWCNNVVTIEHKNKTAIDRVVKAFKAGTLCNEFVPVPEVLKDERLSTYGDEENNRLRNETREKHGFESWYDFCVSKWGTKWDVEGDVDDRSDKTVSISFDSAWSPPVGVYAAMAEEGYNITAHYYEPGIGFAGTWSSADGDVEYSTDNMPVELDDLFGHSANQEMWEE